MGDIGRSFEGDLAELVSEAEPDVSVRVEAALALARIGYSSCHNQKHDL